MTASRTSSARGVMITLSTYCSISSRSSRPVECCGAPAAARWLRGQPCSGFKGGSLENGLLHVDLVREIQEAMKPRAIPIANSGKLLEVNPPEVAASDRLKFGSAPVFGALARPSDAARGRGFQFLSVRRWSMILLNHRMISVLTERCDVAREGGNMAKSGFVRAWMLTGIASAVVAGSVGFAGLAYGQTFGGPRDPGVRGGDHGAGDHLPNLMAGEIAFFELGK